MHEIWNTKKEAPFLGLTGMGGGVASLMFAGASLEKNALYIWGNNEKGWLGQNDRTNRSSPIQVGTENIWTKFQMGYGCFGIKNDGTLWSWGRNASGCLGINLSEMGGPSGNTVVNEGISSPTQVGTDTTWGFASNSRGSTVAHKTDGTMWIMGTNCNSLGGFNGGSDGNGAIYYRSSPVQMPVGTSWTEPVISWSYQSTFHAINDSNELWFFGQNRYGNSGIDSLDHSKNYSSPIQVPGSYTWVGGDHNQSVMAVKSDGTSWRWGRNYSGTLGLGDNTERSSPTQVSGGGTGWQNSGQCGYHSISQANGAIYSSGANLSGQLGLNSRTYQNVPTQIGSNSDWVMCSMGYNAGLAARNGGKRLYCWGASNSGRNGKNNNTAYSSPIQVGGSNEWNAIDDVHAGCGKGGNGNRTWAMKKG